MRGIARGVRAAAYVVRYRVSLGRRMRVDSLTAILGDIEAGAPNGGRGRSATSTRGRISDRALFFALRAGESLVSRMHVAQNTCLFRALGRYALLRRHGRDAVFVMGLRSDADGGEGHAWVELDGVPFRESLAPELVVTLRHPR